MKPEPSETDFRYGAFLSYRTSDLSLARWLHRRIERYRVPKGLVGQPGIYGPIPPKVGPVFRDRDDARTAEDIETIIAQELSKSKHLVVLCSPSASDPESWVSREIELFRARRPDGVIHAVIADGEPPACFPTPLRSIGSEGKVNAPLAADLRSLRKGGMDGRDRAVIKLIAGLIGAQFDELWRRERRRHFRNLFVYSVSAMLAAVLITGVFKYVNDISDSRRLAAHAVNLIDGQYDLALLLASEAYKTAQTEEAEDALFSAVLARPYVRKLLSDLSPQVTVSGDGSVLAAGNSHGGTSLYDRKTAKLKRTFPGGTDGRVRAVRLSNDGSRLAVLAEGGNLDQQMLSVFRTADGALIERQNAGFAGFEESAFDFDSSNALGTAFGTSALPAGVAPLAFTGDGSRVAFVDKEMYVVVVDVNSKAVIKRFGDPRSEDTRPGALAFSENGAVLTIATPDSVEVWSTTDAETSPRFVSDKIDPQDIVVTDSPPLVVALTQKGVIKGYDLTSGKLVLNFRAHDDQGLSYGVSGPGARLAWNATRNTLVSSTRDGRIAAWLLPRLLNCVSTTNCEPIARFSRVRGGHLTSLALSGDGTAIFSAGYEGGIEEYSLTENEDMFLLVPDLGDAEYVTVAQATGNIAVVRRGEIDIRNRAGTLRTLPLPAGCRERRPTGLAISADSRWVLIAQEERACIVDSLAPSTPARILLPPSREYRLAGDFIFSESSRWLAGRYRGKDRDRSYGDDVGTVVWDLSRSGTQAHTLPQLGAVGFVGAETLVSETQGAQIIRTDLGSGLPLESSGKPLSAEAGDWSYSVQAQTLYTSGNPGILIKTDLRAARSGLLFDPTNRPAGEYLRPAVSGNGKLVAVGNGDGVITVWTSEGRRIGSSLSDGHKSSIRELAFVFGDTALLVKWGDGKMQVLNMAPNDWTALAESRAGRHLTTEERSLYTETMLRFEPRHRERDRAPETASSEKSKFDDCFVAHPEADLVSDDQMFVPLACSQTMRDIASRVSAHPVEDDSIDAQVCRQYAKAIDENPILLSGMQDEWAMRALARRDIRMRDAMVLIALSGTGSRIESLRGLQKNELTLDETKVLQWATRFLMKEGRDTGDLGEGGKDVRLTHRDLLAWPRCAAADSTLLNTSLPSLAGWPRLRQHVFPTDDPSGAFYQFAITKPPGAEYASAAEIWLVQKKFDAARRAIAEALQVAPNDGSSLNMAGLIELRAGRCEVALPYFAKSRLAGRMDGWPQYNSAQCLETLGRVAEAQAAYAAATAEDIQPRNQEEHAQFLYGYARFLVRNVPEDRAAMKKAEGYATEAVRITQEENGDYIDTLAAIKFVMEDSITAARLESQAIELSRTNNGDTADFELRLKKYLLAQH